MKIFIFRYPDNCIEAVAACRIIEAIAIIMNHYGVPIDHLNREDLEVTELPRGEWHKFFIYDNNEMPLHTYEEWVKENNGPGIIYTETP